MTDIEGPPNLARVRIESESCFERIGLAQKIENAIVDVNIRSLLLERASHFIAAATGLKHQDNSNTTENSLITRGPRFSVRIFVVLSKIKKKNSPEGSILAVATAAEAARESPVYQGAGARNGRVDRKNKRAQRK